MQRVEGFFKNQVQVFDAAVRMEAELKNDLSYLQKKEEEANQALNEIRKITLVEAGQTSVYKRIPELNGLMDTVREGHGRLLQAKRAEILEIIRQCLAEIHTLAVMSMKLEQFLGLPTNSLTRRKKSSRARKPAAPRWSGTTDVGIQR